MDRVQNDLTESWSSGGRGGGRDKTSIALSFFPMEQEGEDERRSDCTKKSRARSKREELGKVCRKLFKSTRIPSPQTRTKKEPPPVLTPLCELFFPNMAEKQPDTKGD